MFEARVAALERTWRKDASKPGVQPASESRVKDLEFELGQLKRLAAEQVCPSLGFWGLGCGIRARSAGESVWRRIFRDRLRGRMTGLVLSPNLTPSIANSAGGDDERSPETDLAGKGPPTCAVASRAAAARRHCCQGCVGVYGSSSNQVSGDSRQITCLVLRVWVRIPSV